MSEMIERVARALADRFMLSASMGTTPDMPYWREMAGIAIEAMREPNDDMLTEAINRNAKLEMLPGQAWRAMIDAALTPPQTAPLKPDTPEAS